MGYCNFATVVYKLRFFIKIERVNAPALGAGGRGFESRYPDEKDKVSNFELIQFVPAFFICIF